MPQIINPEILQSGILQRFCPASAQILQRFGWVVHIREYIRREFRTEKAAPAQEGQWKLTFKKVGPGVFFALFACIGLVYAVTSPLTLGPRTAGKGGDRAALGAAVVTASYDAPAADKLARDEIKAINTLTILWRSDRLPNAPATLLLR
jgi:hypothetical protein